MEKIGKVSNRLEGALLVGPAWGHVCFRMRKKMEGGGWKCWGALGETTYAKYSEEWSSGVWAGSCLPSFQFWELQS